MRQYTKKNRFCLHQKTDKQHLFHNVFNFGVEGEQDNISVVYLYFHFGRKDNIVDFFYVYGPFSKKNLAILGTTLKIAYTFCNTPHPPNNCSFLIS